MPLAAAWRLPAPGERCTIGTIGKTCKSVAGRHLRMKRFVAAALSDARLDRLTRSRIRRPG